MAAAFDLSYRDLTADQQRLFRLLGLHPGADFDVYVAAALAGTNLSAARGLLDGLFIAHLVDEPARSRYNFHDLISEHSRNLVSAEGVNDRELAINRLLSYYSFAARSAHVHLARRAYPAAQIGLEPPAEVPELPSRVESAAWMNVERFNLHAVADYASLSGREDLAIAVASSMHEFLRGHGHWDQAVAIQRLALGAAQRSGDRRSEADALQCMGDIQRLLGNFSDAAVSQQAALSIFRNVGDRYGEAAALNQLGFTLRRMSNFPAAISILESARDLCRELKDVRGKLFCQRSRRCLSAYGRILCCRRISRTSATPLQAD